MSLDRKEAGMRKDRALAALVAGQLEEVADLGHLEFDADTGTVPGGLTRNESGLVIPMRRVQAQLRQIKGAPWSMAEWTGPAMRPWVIEGRWNVGGRR